jgi:hypothetical protein
VNSDAHGPGSLVCGRLELRCRYPDSSVYDNFSWPAPTDKRRSAIETATQSVLDAHKKHPELSLATLYDSNATPPELIKAHPMTTVRGRRIFLNCIKR